MTIFYETIEENSKLNVLSYNMLRINPRSFYGGHAYEGRIYVAYLVNSAL